MKRFPEPPMPLRAYLQLLAPALALTLAACAGHGGVRPEQPAPAQQQQYTPPSRTPSPASAVKGDSAQRFAQAVQLMKDHKTDEAQAALEALVKDFPNYSGPLTDLGILYAHAKQRDQAFNSFNKAVAANPNNATAYNWIGILSRESGDYAGAERAYQKALAAQPNDAASHLNLAILYDSYLRRPQDAVAQYREYQRIAGNDKVIVTAWIDELQPPPEPAVNGNAAPASGNSSTAGGSPGPAGSGASNNSPSIVVPR